MAWVIVLAVFAVFGRTIGHEFTEWDDRHTIQENHSFLPPTWTKIGDYWAITENADSGRAQSVNHQYGLWVPLTYSFWGAVAQVAQVRDPAGGSIELNPFVFHAANVTLHAGAAVLVLVLLRRLTGSSSAAGIGAMLFALHPLQTEAVAWASGTKDLLAGLLGFAALLAYLRSVSHETPAARRRGWWYLATLLFVAGMLAKPSAMTVVALAGLIDWLWLRRPLQSVLVTTIPWLVLALPIAIIAKSAQPGVTLDPIPAWAPPLIAMDSLAFYLVKLVWPINLAFDYGRPPSHLVREGAIFWTWTIPAAVTVAALLAAARGRRAPLLAWLIFVAAPLPVLGLTPFMFQFYSTTADHYVYVAMLGPAFLLASAVASRPGRATFVAAALLLGTLAGLSFRQAGYWRDGETLYARSVAVAPRGSGALNNLALIHARREDYATAERLLRQSHEARPDSILTLSNLLEVVALRDRPEEAMDLLRREIRLKQTLPDFATGAYWTDPNHMGKLLLLRGRYSEAVNHFTLLNRLRPDDATAPKMLILARQMLEKQPPATRPSAPAATAPGLSPP